ncbi:MAG: signal peptidase [Frankiaceae bacterium]|jgi:signal peptidase I|nr:signal peptidase [Frankiaceae bacterium]
MGVVTTEAAVRVDEDDEDEAYGRKSYPKEMVVLVVVALALALIMKAVLVQAFFIPSGSMEKTLHGCEGCRGDRVLVNKVVYKFRDIHRGEIVVFNGKGTPFNAEFTPKPAKNFVEKVRRELQSAVGFGGPGDKDFIKRVIGVPGDVVACCTNDHVTVNGQELDEPYVYLEDPATPQMAFPPVTVPKGQLFLMGDHRDGSADSRFHGPVPESKVVGRAFAVFFPAKRAKVLRVPGTFDSTKHQAQGPLPGSVAAPPVLALALAMPVTAFRLRRRRSGRATAD